MTQGRQTNTAASTFPRLALLANHRTDLTCTKNISRLPSKGERKQSDLNIRMARVDIYSATLVVSCHGCKFRLKFVSQIRQEKSRCDDPK